MNIGKRKDLAIKIAREIGRLLLANFGKKLKVSEKGDRDLVSNIDKKAEEIAIRLIKKHYPEDSILSEESGHLPSAAGFRWIIDPIDGTHNYIYNIEIFGTSVALEYGDEVILGAIYMPVGDELYTAQKGKGAYRNGKKISVSKRSLKEATLIYDSTIRLDKEPMLRKLGELSDRVFNVRMLGSTVRALTYLAEGKVDIEIEFHDKLWDFAAGLLLVKEAGGEATDFQGKPWSTGSKNYIASNAIAHKELIDIMSGGGEK
ncbi:MAG: inositol monophosphatase [Candidatus Omnitrophota bacterium]|nr:MAG: inositol monophosphatase [Candidatus Omnitrophota bacterium]